MNPWLRGLWDTIHFQHRCESLAAFGKRFQAEWEESGEGLWVKGWGEGGLERDVQFGCICLNVCLLTPLRAPLAWNPACSRCYISSLGALCFQFSSRHPFCLRARWQLSLLVTSKEAWIIDFIANVAAPASHPPRRIVETGNDEACAQMHNAHACSHTNKHTYTYTYTGLIISPTLLQSNSSGGWWLPKRAQNYTNVEIFTPKLT